MTKQKNILIFVKPAKLNGVKKDSSRIITNSIIVSKWCNSSD